MKALANLSVSVLFALLSIPAHLHGATGPSVDELFTGKVTPVLYVRDVQRSIRFYCDELGFRFVSESKGRSSDKHAEPPYAANVAAGSQEFLLHQFTAATGLPLTKFKGIRGRYHVEVKDLTAYYELLRSRGLKTHHFIPLAGKGVFMFAVTDPDGHDIFFNRAVRPAG